MKPSSQKWLLEAKDLIPMPFSVLEAGLMIATAALPVVGHRRRRPLLLTDQKTLYTQVTLSVRPCEYLISARLSSKRKRFTRG
jgi:hypothetical protein